MKHCIIATIALAAGILLGIAVHSLSVRAQVTPTGNVYVDELMASGTAVRGSQIVRLFMCGGRQRCDPLLCCQREPQISSKRALRYE